MRKLVTFLLLLLAPLTTLSAETWTVVCSEKTGPATVTTYKTVNWQYGHDGKWSPSVSRPAGRYDCNNAGWGSDPAPGDPKFMRIDDATATQQATGLPAGVTRIALAGEFFPHPTTIDVVMADMTYSAASRSLPARFYGIAGQGNFCKPEAFEGETATAACYSIPLSYEYTDQCFTWDWRAYNWDELTPADSSLYTHAVSWVAPTGCGDAVEVLLYNQSERKALLEQFANLPIMVLTGQVSQLFIQLNAYGRSQPGRILTASEHAAHLRLQAKYNPATVPPVVPVYVVQNESTTKVGERAVYKLTAAGNVGSSVTGTKVPAATTVCNVLFKALDKPNYMGVKGQKTTTGTVITGDYVAACVIKP